MGLNHINLEAAGKFLEEAKRDGNVAKKSKKVEGEWVFEEGQAQFRATLAYPKGERVVESDFAPFLGGLGLAPDPIQYCLYGLAACYAGTFVSIAAMKGVTLNSVKVAAENNVDLSRTLGLSRNPIVERVELTLTVETDAPRNQLEEIENLAHDRCPGVYCTVNSIPLRTRLATKSERKN